MKKVLKITGLVLGTIILLALLGFLFINSSDIPSYEIRSIDYKVVSTPESVARGKKLALILCANCHRNSETGKLTGTKMLDVPKEFGEIYSQNITQDKTFGIGGWSDGELLYLLRTGIKKDGQYAPPYMAKLPNMADSDVNAIISFLRSDDRLVAADPTPDIPPKPSFVTKLLSRLAWKPFPMPTDKIILPDTTQTLALGRYLAVNLDCYACHSADLKTVDFLHPEQSPGYFGGGTQLLDMEGRAKNALNITPDKETGIGDWSEYQFVQAVKYGSIDGDKALTYPMVPYLHLSDTEVAAIYQYLKTIPPINHQVVRLTYD
jgi:mono/diheme cytochrome c family protein